MCFVWLLSCPYCIVFDRCLQFIETCFVGWVDAMGVVEGARSAARESSKSLYSGICMLSGGGREGSISVCSIEWMLLDGVRGAPSISHEPCCVNGLLTSKSILLHYCRDTAHDSIGRCGSIRNWETQRLFISSNKVQTYC